jgi:hypothetical protein
LNRGRANLARRRSPAAPFRDEAPDFVDESLEFRRDWLAKSAGTSIQIFGTGILFFDRTPNGRKCLIALAITP